jgi:hypothetical protein
MKTQHTYIHIIWFVTWYLCEISEHVSLVLREENSVTGTGTMFKHGWVCDLSVPASTICQTVSGIEALSARRGCDLVPLYVASVWFLQQCSCHCRHWRQLKCRDRRFHFKRKKYVVHYRRNCRSCQNCAVV